MKTEQEILENLFFPPNKEWGISSINTDEDKEEVFVEVADIFERHLIGIVNAIKTGANNARAERLNGAIQELKVIGRGYRNTDNFRIAILFFNGNLDLFPHNSQ
jgi:transposase